jgi:hypothetical protein
MRLMSPPLEQRNATWAAKWDTLPEPGEWRQTGCKHKPPKQSTAKQPAKRTRPARRRTNARQRKQQDSGGILGTLARLLR